MKRWSYSLIFLVVYVLVFHVWNLTGRDGLSPASLAVTLVAMIGLTAVFVRAAKSYYFVNHWDCWLHASVILDVLLEGTLIKFHSGNGFYLCALGFAIVIGGYRAYIIKNNLVPLRFGNQMAT